MTTYVSQSIEGVNFSGIYTPYDQTAAISTTNDPSSGGPPFKAGTAGMFINGRWATGLPAVAMFLSAFNPAGLKRRPQVALQKGGFASASGCGQKQTV